MSAMDEELKAIKAKLEEIGQMAALGCKTVLDLQEASVFTGYSSHHLYRLTSQRGIPHYKKNRKLYFKKAELEDWLLSDYVKTDRDIQSEAATYVATHPNRRRNRIR